MSRRPGITFLAVALVLIVLLNGAWFYSSHGDQSLGSALSGSGSGLGSGSDGPVVQPEKPPQVDPEEDKALFDHGAKGSGEQQEKESEQPFATTTTAAATVHGQEATTTTTPGLDDVLSSDKIDWSRFAYVQYVTATEHVCNSVMVFESLHRLGSKADRVLLYPREWGPVDGPSWKALDSKATAILAKAKDKYHVKLRPVDLIKQKGQEPTWEAGFTKLLAFNQTDYSRTIMFDNDATVLKHMDHLFLLPPAPLALPRAYWLGPDPLPEKTINKYKLSAQLLVITPDPVVFAALLDAVHNKGTDDYDMEILNWVFGPVALVLPHRALNLLSGEFRREHKPGYKGYDRYLGIMAESWNAKKVLDEAYYVHFSDWPNPKPWYHPNKEKLPDILPKCYPKVPTISGHDSRHSDDKNMDCSDKETWLWLYSDFKDRRKNICGLDLMDPPPIRRRLYSEPQWDV